MTYQMMVAIAGLLVLAVSCLGLGLGGTDRDWLAQQQLSVAVGAATDNRVVEEEENRKTCHTSSYRKNTLKLVKETPFAGLFGDLKNQTKFEGSGVAAVDGMFYVVFDSSMSIGLLDESFSFRGERNRLIGEWQKESQYEGIAHVPENDTFLLLHEALPSSTGTSGGGNTYTPYTTIGKIKPDLSGYDELDLCRVNFELTHENKGFESIAYVQDSHGQPLMLGLCEGNHCQGGSKGRDGGNGRIVVSKLTHTDDGSCVWEPIKIIKIPEAADFQDYSAMAVLEQRRKIAILSQENAAVFVRIFSFLLVVVV